MLERVIESVVMSALSEALPDGVSIQGAWQPSGPGAVKGHESPDAVAYVGVAVSPRAFETFTTPKATFSVAVSLKVRDERDPDGSTFNACAESILAKLQAWQTSIQDVRADFQISGFAPSGLRIDGGSVLRDDVAGAMVMSESFTIRGILC